MYHEPPWPKVFSQCVMVVNESLFEVDHANGLSSCSSGFTYLYLNRLFEVLVVMVKPLKLSIPWMTSRRMLSGLREKYIANSWSWIGKIIIFIYIYIYVHLHHSQSLWVPCLDAINLALLTCVRRNNSPCGLFQSPWRRRQMIHLQLCPSKGYYNQIWWRPKSIGNLVYGNLAAGSAKCQGSFLRKCWHN